jgi:hypothetical protein
MARNFNLIFAYSLVFLLIFCVVTEAGQNDSIIIAQAQQIPSGLPQQAAQAMEKAKSWRPDAILVMVEVNDLSRSGKFDVRYSFYSPSDGSGLWISESAIGGETVNQAGQVNWITKPIPKDFRDLPDAVSESHRLGMEGGIDHATLMVWPVKGLIWRVTPINPTTDFVYDIPSELPGSHQEENQKLAEPWQTSWDEFVKEVQRLYDSGADEDQFIKRFNGKQVIWEGEFVKSYTNFDSKPLTVDVLIHMPDRQVRLPGGSKVPFWNITLSIPVEKELYIPNGKVRFRVTLYKGDEIFFKSAVHTFQYTDKTKNIDETGIDVLTEDDAKFE